MKLKPLLTSLFIAPLLGVSSLVHSDTPLFTYEFYQFPENIDFHTINSSGDPYSACPLLAGVTMPNGYEISRAHYSNSYGLCDTYRIDDGVEKKNMLPTVRWRRVSYTPPENTDPCAEGMTNAACCEDTAVQACMAYGGLHDFTWYPQDAIGGERCEYVCSDDLPPPDPDPTPDPDPGENPDPHPGDDDPDPTDPGDDDPDPSDPDPDEDWDYTPPSPGQGAIVNIGGGAESGGVTVDVAVDTSAIEGWLNILADKPGFNDELIREGLQAFRDRNHDDLRGVIARLGEMESSLVAVSEDGNATLREIRDRLSSGGDGEVGILPDIDVYFAGDEYSVPGIHPDNPHAVNDPLALSAFVRNRLEDAGLDPDELDLDDFELDRIDITERMGDFQPFLPPSECPRQRIYDLNGLSFQMNFGPLCDVFGWIGYLVLASAWFSVPFIVFGVSKK